MLGLHMSSSRTLRMLYLAAFFVYVSILTIWTGYRHGLWKRHEGDWKPRVSWRIQRRPRKIDDDSLLPICPIPAVYNTHIGIFRCGRRWISLLLEQQGDHANFPFITRNGVVMSTIIDRALSYVVRLCFAIAIANDICFCHIRLVIVTEHEG